MQTFSYKMIIRSSVLSCQFLDLKLSTTKEPFFSTITLCYSFLMSWHEAMKELFLRNIRSLLEDYYWDILAVNLLYKLTYSTIGISNLETKLKSSSAYLTLSGLYFGRNRILAFSFTGLSKYARLLNYYEMISWHSGKGWNSPMSLLIFSICSKLLAYSVSKVGLMVFNLYYLLSALYSIISKHLSSTLFKMQILAFLFTIPTGNSIV